MKLSTFPNFADLNSPTPTPGAGAPAAPLLEFAADLNSAGDSPAGEASGSNFAAIFGGVAAPNQSARELPKAISSDLPNPPALALLNEPAFGIPQFCAFSNGDAEGEINADPDAAATNDVTKSCVAPRGDLFKGRAPRRPPELERPSGLTADNPAWAHLLATPAAIAAPSAPLCALPVPPESGGAMSIDEESARGTKPAASDTDPAAIMFAAQQGYTSAGLNPRNGLADERQSAVGVEQRAIQVNEVRLAPVGTEARPTAVTTRSPEFRGPTLPRDTSAPTPGADASKLESQPRPVAAADPMAPAAQPAADANRAKQLAGGGTELSLSAGHPETHRREIDDTASTAAPEHELLDTTPTTDALHESRWNSGVGLSRNSIRATQVEKLSGASATHRQDGIAHESIGDKTLIPSGESMVTKERTGVGTGGAKSDAPMPSTVSALESSAFAADPALASRFDLAADGQASDAGSIESSAHTAVESILSLAENLAMVDHQSVNLRFSIGENDLRVRVGYSGDEVRTTFVTESPELRAALLQEWQSLASSASDRASARFAEPVFSSAGRGEFGTSNSSFDSASQQQREPAARRDPPAAPAEFFRSRAADRDFTTPASAMPVRDFASASSTQRLHTFA
jgi:hypothetical protein